MHNTADNAAYDSACSGMDREFRIGVEIEKNDGWWAAIDLKDTPKLARVLSVEWTNVASPNNSYCLGTFSYNEIKVSLHSDLRSLLRDLDPIIGRRMKVDSYLQGVSSGWTPLGVYYISDVTVSGDGKDFVITGYDGVPALSEKFDYNALGVTFPCNAWTLLNAICTYFDAITIADDIRTGSIPYILKRVVFNDAGDLPDGTYREYLGWIAGLVGANARMGRALVLTPSGSKPEIEIAKYEDTGFTITRDLQHMDGVRKKYNGSITYTNIISGTEESPMSGTGRSGNAILCIDPLMPQSRLDDLCDEILGNDGLTIVPADVTWRGNPRFESCDVLSVEEYNGSTYSLYIMEQNLTITGGVREVSHSYAETEEFMALTSSPLNARFNQYLPLTGGNVDSLTVNNSPVITEDTSHLETYTSVTQLGLTAGSATISGVWSAMPSDSMLLAYAGDFDLGEVPSALGVVRICKNDLYDGTIEFFFNDVANDGVYVMGIDGSGDPDGTWTRICIPPVGSVVITSTNTNPSATYGGTWTLIDKEFKVLEVDTTNYTDYFTPDANTTVSVMRMHRTGHAVHIFRFAFTYGVALTDTTVTFGVLNLNALGISSIPNAIYCTANSDGGNGIAMTQISTAGDLASIDVVTKTSGGNIPAGVAIGLGMASIDLLPSQMADSACDKFYWKRTA